MRKLTATLLLLLGSVIAYAINGMVGYVTLQRVGLYEFFFLWSLGGLIALPIIIRAMRMRSDLFRNFKAHYISFAGGSLLVAFNLMLFIAFKHYMLARVYPLIALSSIVFFIIDMIVFGGKMKAKADMAILSGIVFVVIGVYMVESIGVSFDYGMLPYIVAIMLTAGVGYYLAFHNIKRYSVGSKLMSIAIPSFIASALLAVSYGAFRPITLAYGAGVVLAGATFMAAVGFELKAVKRNETVRVVKDVIERNLINNFTYLDTILVLVGSIAIRSFTWQQIAGGLLIVLGVVVMALTKERYGHR